MPPCDLRGGRGWKGKIERQWSSTIIYAQSLATNPSPSSPSHLQSPMASSHNSPPFHRHFAELNDKDFQVHGHSILLLVAAFTVLLLLSLLFLYAWWVLLYRLRLRHDGRVPKPPPTAGLDEVTIKSFPVKLHRAGAGGSQESECSICLAVFVEMEKVKGMPVCGHAFHLECIDVWLSAHRSCPLCRAALGESAAETV